MPAADPGFMFEWITQNANVLSLVIDIGMLAVWLTYLHVFLNGFQRQTRSKIVINRGVGNDLDARCLISNMSSESIYVESIVASVEAAGRDWRCTVTDIDTADGQELPPDPKQRTHQGPLRAGDYMDIGSYRQLLDRVFKGHGSAGAVLGELDAPIVAQVEVVADYASEDLLVGARRRFNLELHDGRWLLKAKSGGTEQIRAGRERRRMSSALAD
jgi:hypothetical protein